MKVTTLIAALAILTTSGFLLGAPSANAGGVCISQDGELVFSVGGGPTPTSCSSDAGSTATVIGGGTAAAEEGSTATVIGFGYASATGSSSALATGGSAAGADDGSTAIATGGSVAIALSGSTAVATGIGSFTPQPNFAVADDGGSTSATGGCTAINDDCQGQAR